jgi:hypothetical protein
MPLDRTGKLDGFKTKANVMDLPASSPNTYDPYKSEHAFLASAPIR